MEPELLGEYLPVFARAAWLTLWVGLTGIVCAVVVGLACAVVQHFRVPFARQLVSAYIELSRNTPLVVQLFFLYFGLPKLGIVLSSATCAIVGLAFLGGSYMAEAIRSGLEAVDDGQSQSALALGLSRGLTLRHVVLPQAVALAMPAFTANIIFLIKETSVVSIVALPDLMYVAKDLIGTDYNTREALTLLVAFYLVILLPISLGAGKLEKKVRYAAFGS
ncbi:MAG: amino acid ABC transporter permease [Propionibacteriaceae bacterium]|jgi:polar amino acid transport system permease protein|nr:amino acid ABC transporter permease [Propionibacteriaceae bacterium]